MLDPIIAIKKFTKRSFDWLSIFMLLFVAGDASIANWGPSIWGTIFARVRGPWLYNAHVWSMLPICIIAGYYVYKTGMKSLFWGAGTWVFCLFSVASCHELLLSIFYLGHCVIEKATIFGLPILACNGGVDSVYGTQLAIVLIVALALGNRAQRITITKTAVLDTCLFCVLVPLYFYAHIGGPTIIGFTPTPLYYNITANLWEMAAWVSSTILWLPQLYYRGLNQPKTVSKASSNRIIRIVNWFKLTEEDYHRR